MKQSKISEILNNLYPQSLASSFDLGKIGLQFGSENKDVKRILIALDATHTVIDEAINKKCDLIITHHPTLFYPITSINYDSNLGEKIVKIIKNNINIYSMHTNFDVSNNGMNEILATKLGLVDIHAQTDEITSDCFVRIGEVETTNLSSYCKQLSKKLPNFSIKYVGSSDKKISKVAIVGGAGTSEISVAMRLGCDCLITGEVKHHQALEAVETNFAIIEIDHYIESLFKEPLLETLKASLPKIEILISVEETNPFNIIK